MSTFWSQILDWLFPPRCVGCRTNGAWFCDTCANRCQLVSDRENDYQHTRLGATALTTSVGVFIFASPLREAIHALKYQRRHVLAQPLGELLVNRYAAIPTVDAIIAVPLFSSRMRERGFNQAAVLAQVLARKLNIKYVDGPLRRVRATEHQAQLGRAERQTNVQDAFNWLGSPPPKRLLLVDDVLTTGATMAACAATLAAAGAHEVHGLALARGGA